MDLRAFNNDDIYIKVYDPEKQELIGTYTSYKEAAKVLGMTYKNVYSGCATKKRRYSPYLRKEVAIRAAGIKK